MASVPKSAGELIVARAPLIPILPNERREANGITVGELCESFLESKRLKLASRELSPSSIVGYERAYRRLVDFFGANRDVLSIAPIEFAKFRASFPAHWGPESVGHTIQAVRTIGKWGFENGYLPQPAKFGSEFCKPSLKMYRRARRKAGSRMLEAAEIRSLIDAAPPIIRAMIMLGVNCGFGNADCGRLPLLAINLKTGWINFARPKTEVDRRCPLWPETVQAIERAMVVRPKPASAESRRLAFLTRFGTPWSLENYGHATLSQNFRLLFGPAGVNRGKRGFYCLRRTFRTIASDVMDEVAASAIMGHAPKAGDMAAVYTQRISDDRLIAVSECVRAWLFPDETANYFKQFQVKAATIRTAWDQQPTISAGDVRVMLKELGVKQHELARGIGLNAQWVNALICDRKAISTATQARIRTFVNQLAEGKNPKPVTIDKAGLSCSLKAANAVKSERKRRRAIADEAIHDALVAATFSHRELRTVVEQLRYGYGVTQVAIAKYLAISKRQLNDMIFNRGRYVIPQRPVVVRMVELMMTVKGGAT